mmetsp:Transcript_26415/g.52717  ORF Transcript_26415/g.52717 Transcript_26415/m.52717 type:complete len:332 (-) Transcript_26415:1263-2258(-)
MDDDGEWVPNPPRKSQSPNKSLAVPPAPSNAIVLGPDSGVVPVIDSSNSTRKRSYVKREGQDCGTCVYCRDKPKFGGPGRMKQACKARRKVQIERPGDYVEKPPKKYKTKKGKAPKFEDLTGVYQSMAPTLNQTPGLNRDELTWDEADEPQDNSIQTFTTQIHRPSPDSLWPLELRYCLVGLPASSGDDKTKQPAAYVVHSTAAPEFATFWPQAKSRSVTLRRGDVLVGIAGTPLQSLLSSSSESLSPIASLFSGSSATSLDLTVFRDAEATLPKAYHVNPSYGVPYYDCDSDDENSKGDWEPLLPAERAPLSHHLPLPSSLTSPPTQPLV